MFTMCLESDANNDTAFQWHLDHTVNYVFVGLFTLEALVKMISYRLYFFTNAWNCFDLTIIILSYLGT